MRLRLIPPTAVTWDPDVACVPGLCGLAFQAFPMARQSAGPPALLRTSCDPAPSLGCPWNVRTGSVPHVTQQTVASRTQGAGWQAGRRGRLSPRTHEGGRGVGREAATGKVGPAGCRGPCGGPRLLHRRVSTRFLLWGVTLSPRGLFR